jgi:hypothetical protein
MPNPDLATGALILLLRHDFTGCARAAHQAAGLLERIAESAGLDTESRDLCRRMSDRLQERVEGVA